MVVLLSGMEEKSQAAGVGRGSPPFQSSSLLTSVRLQFLAGCFGLGTVGTSGTKGESVQLHHYQVLSAGAMLTLARPCCPSQALTLAHQCNSYQVVTLAHS